MNRSNLCRDQPRSKNINSDTKTKHKGKSPRGVDKESLFRVVLLTKPHGPGPFSNTLCGTWRGWPHGEASKCDWYASTYCHFPMRLICRHTPVLLKSDTFISTCSTLSCPHQRCSNCTCEQSSEQQEVRQAAGNSGLSVKVILRIAAFSNTY